VPAERAVDNRDALSTRNNICAALRLSRPTFPADTAGGTSWRQDELAGGQAVVK
jgi:hypothetical protein